MSHATSHATLAAREVLIIPRPPVVIANRLDTRETTVSRASGLLAEISSGGLENRQGAPTSRLSSDGGRNERPAVHPTGHDTYPKLTAHSTTNTRMPTSLSPRMHARYFTWYPRPPMQAP